jgi:hypothetical protein
MSAAVDRDLAAARHAFAACEALFRSGLTPECHPYMLRALHASLAAWSEPVSPPPSDEPSTPPEPTTKSAEDTALTALAAARYPDLDRLRKALELTAATMPTDFEWVWAEAERLYGFSARRLAPESTRRRRRVGFAVLLGLGGVVAIVLAFRLWGRARITASATFSTDFAAPMAIDGNDATEWLPPDGEPAWLEIRLPRARRITGVRVYNGHNRFYVDRGTGNFRITLYAGERKVASAENHFERVTDQITKIDVPIQGDDVTMIRFDALTFLGRGVAVGEIEWR